MEKVNEGMNFLVMKEKRETLSNIWQNFINGKDKRKTVQLESQPLVISIASAFVPEAVPILQAASDFFKSDAGKEITDFVYKPYDVLGEIASGTFSTENEGFKKIINIYTVNEKGQLVRDDVHLAEEVGAMHI